MRLIAALASCALTCGASFQWAHADPVMPQPFTAAYAVSYRGIGAGTLTFKLKRDAASGHYTYETSAAPSALARFVISSAAVERSVMEIGPEGVRPLEWKLDDGKSGDKRDGELHFDWAAQTVTGRVERKPVNLSTEPGLQDRLSIQIAVTSALLRGVEPGTIALVDDNRIKRYAYTRKESAAVDTALGKLDTIVYESTRDNSNRVSRFWMAPQLGFTAVRAEQIRDGKVETVMVLTTLERR